MLYLHIFNKVMWFNISKNIILFFYNLLLYKKVCSTLLLYFVTIIIIIIIIFIFITNWTLEKYTINGTTSASISVNIVYFNFIFTFLK